MSKEPTSPNTSEAQRLQEPSLAPTERVELTVPPESLQQTYQTLAADIARREQNLAEELPIDTAYGISDCLQAQQARWESNVKSLRSAPVLNSYDTVVDDPLETDYELKRLLVGLDAAINVLDDIIDTADADHDKRISHAVNVAFAQTMVAGDIPSAHQETLGEILTQYLTEIFQIPLVERELLSEFQSTDVTDQTTRLDIARSIYAYRGHAISAFARIPAIVYDLEETVADRFVADLETLRARQLIYKDISDVERDIRDDDQTVILSLLQSRETDASQVTAFIDDLHEEFSYSAESDGRYRELLKVFEYRPTDLEEEIRQRTETVHDLTNSDIGVDSP